MVKVELLYFDGCPGYRKAEQSLAGALSQEGIRSEVELVAVNTDEEAGALKSPGSPTIRMDGQDLFPSSAGDRDDQRLCCRVYATPEGLKDHPTEEMIRAALRRSPVRPPDASGEPGGRKSVEGEDAEDAPVVAQGVRGVGRVAGHHSGSSHSGGNTPHHRGRGDAVLAQDAPTARPHPRAT